MTFLTAIPIYNEERHLEHVLREVRRSSPHILIVNDGSTDRTGELLAAQTGIAVVTHPQNRGYGAALISAFDYVKEHAEYDVLVTMDCDGQHEPGRIPVLLEAIHDADIVSGSRYLRDFRQDGAAPQDRRHINQEITAELNARFGLHITDAFCGFKAYRREALAALHITETSWGLPLQLLVQAAHAGPPAPQVRVPPLYPDPHCACGATLTPAANRYHAPTRIRRAVACQPQRRLCDC